jgi:hypothetical protein
MGGAELGESRVIGADSQPALKIKCLSAKYPTAMKFGIIADKHKNNVEKNGGNIWSE